MELVGEVRLEQQGLARTLGDGQRPLGRIIPRVIEVIPCILPLPPRTCNQYIIIIIIIIIIIRPSRVTA